ncbi:MAG: hypothetical protein KC502_22125 [Myxococcales bacterium]|nr:hypothetical protein [Myxococcales bacterium]
MTFVLWRFNRLALAPILLATVFAMGCSADDGAKTSDAAGGSSDVVGVDGTTADSGAADGTVIGDAVTEADVTEDKDAGASGDKDAGASGDKDAGVGGSDANEDDAVKSSGDAATAGDTSTQLPTAVTVTVGPKGATLKIEGAELTIGSGALAKEVKISMHAVQVSTLTGGATGLVGKATFAVRLQPHGLKFATPATLKLAVTSDSSEWVMLRQDDGDDTTWAPVGPLTVTKDEVSIALNGFSAYLLSRIDDDCPCWTGNMVRDILTKAKTLKWGSQGSCLFKTSSGTKFVMVDSVADCKKDPRWTSASRAIATGGGSMYFGPNGGWIAATRTLWRDKYDRIKCVNVTRTNPWESWYGTNPDRKKTSSGNWHTLIVNPMSQKQFDSCNALFVAAKKKNKGSTVALDITGLTDAKQVIKVAWSNSPKDTDSATCDKVCGSDPVRHDSTLEPVLPGASYELKLLESPAEFNCTITAPTGKGPAAGSQIVFEIKCVAKPKPGCPCWADKDIAAYTPTQCSLLDTVPANKPDGVKDYLSLNSDKIGRVVATDNTGSNALYCKDTAGNFKSPLTKTEHAKCWADLEKAAKDAGLNCTPPKPTVVCPCWTDKDIAAYTPTKCSLLDTVPANKPDGVKDYLSLDDGKVGRVTATNNTAGNEVPYCKDTTGKSKSPISKAEHTKCWADLEKAAKDAGVKCQ